MLGLLFFGGKTILNKNILIFYKKNLIDIKKSIKRKIFTQFEELITGSSHILIYLKKSKKAAKRIKLNI
ncbi:hypothetical protein DB895_08710 [Flavobacterium psychrotolerans]|uniref:Uncharacterized protein n=1 Tax=Flavobacterium psychrotolerans TaxID=2169410 RepID=A0A2U1JIW0_9FLAO|nr:hypothetical protein DB895_08710 [Flavobacterium psychrotolerans]